MPSRALRSGAAEIIFLNKARYFQQNLQEGQGCRQSCSHREHVDMASSNLHGSVQRLGGQGSSAVGEVASFIYCFIYFQMESVSLEGNTGHDLQAWSKGR